MTRLLYRLFAFLVCAIVWSIPIVPVAAADDLALVGQKVTVITEDAKFTVDDRAVSETSLGESFIVESVKGDSLLIKSRNAYLKRSAVVPFEDAIEYLTRKIKDDASSENYNKRGCCWQERGKFVSAIDDFNAAIRLGPRNVAALTNRGRVWCRKGELDKGIADFDEAIRIDPKYAVAYNDRGIAQCEKGDLTNGVADFNRAIGVEPNNSRAFNNRGKASILKGELDKGLTDFGIAIRLDPNNAAAYINRGYAWIKAGEYDKAYLDYKELTRIDRAAGLNLQAWWRATLPDAKFRDGKKAVRDATEACELTSWENDMYISTLSAALAESGRFDEATKRLQQAIDMHPNNSKEICDEMMVAFKAGKAYRDDAKH